MGINLSPGGETVSRQPHKLETVGATPTLATKIGMDTLSLSCPSHRNKGSNMNNDELTINQKIWLSIVINDKCPYCKSNIEIRPEDMGVNLRTGLFLCRCPRCQKVINIRVLTKLLKDRK